ncbi:MAG: glucuronate isomerase [Oscillospiraceae bacterium]|nr:glucuronate isomerase [Oscillospiraceae bacterium]
MPAFMNEDFLLSTDTARKLYFDHAAKMPIVDYHCHVPPQAIAEDWQYENVTRLFLGGGNYGDHYKWRLMRANGVDEKYITGDAPDRERFQKFAEMLPRAIGSPVYTWTHLELQRYFGYNGALNGDTAEEVWNKCNAVVTGGKFTVRQIIERSNVTAICTTDDPVDDLRWHKQIREDQSFGVKVLPAFRPDKAVNLEKPDYKAYLELLSAASGIAVNSVESLCAAISNRMDFFAENGCRASDHGLDYVCYREDKSGKLEGIFQKGLSNAELTAEEIEIFKTHMMIFLGRENAKRNWVFQIHYGAIRSTNTRMLTQIGADIGFDCLATNDCGRALSSYLTALNDTGELPKTVLYSLNPNDDAMLAAMTGCYQGAPTAGKVQHGSAWWFNDTKTGMQNQMINLANMAVFGNFIGMLTDSRSFVSYPRHEYFRRILCDIVGQWVENGEYPADWKALGTLIEDISYNNAMRYLGL